MEHLSRGHLSPETLARLVDDVPSPPERTHLNRCRRCRDELDALQAQTLGLSHLPDLRPPHGDWDSLELRLRSEGLIGEEDSRSGRRPRRSAGQARGGARTTRDREVTGWMRGAAALLLLVGGAGLGAGAVTALGGGGSSMASMTNVAGDPSAASPSRDLAAVPAALGLSGGGGPASVEEAEELVRLTESWYRSALLRYREAAGRGRTDEDPLDRYIALEALLAAGQAALREAPADPFLNGLLVNMHAEREAALRGMRTSSREEGVWY